MPLIKHRDIKSAYREYVRVTNKLPEKLRQDGCITFSAYIGVDAKPYQLSDGTLRSLSSEGVQRVEQLLGPNGEALFRAWVIKQCEKSE